MTDNALISAEALGELEGADTAIVDCRFSLADSGEGARLYAEGHIPGAHHADMETDLAGPTGKHGGRHPLPLPDDFTDTMRRAGISSDTLVVAYDDNRFAGAARLWWLLRYFGHRRVQVLNGGFAAWRRAGLPVAPGGAPSRPGTFTARPAAGMTVDYQTVLDSLEDGSTTLIDSREGFRYAGEDEPIDPVAGHIPGALNRPWADATDERSFALPAERHAARWRSLAGAGGVVAYCGSGVTACVNLLSLHLAGTEHAKLYPGSWSDWCSYPASPKITREFK